MPACPNCKTTVQNSAELSGNVVSCPACETKFPMPPLPPPVAPRKSDTPPATSQPMSASAAGLELPSSSASEELRRRQDARRRSIGKNLFQIVMLLVSMAFSWFLAAKYLGPALQARHKSGHQGAKAPATDSVPAGGLRDSINVESRRVMPRDLGPTPQTITQRRPVREAEPDAETSNDLAIDEGPSSTTASPTVEPTPPPEYADIRLSGSANYVELPEGTGTPRIELEYLGNFEGAWRFSDGEGLLVRGRPVDLLFEDYPFARLRIEIAKSKLKISPQLDVGEKDPVPFTKQRVSKLTTTTRKRINALSKQQRALHAQLANANAVINAPGAVDLPKLNNAKAVASQCQGALAALGPEFMAMQQRLVALQSLEELRLKLHDRAHVAYYVRYSESSPRQPVRADSTEHR